MKQEVREKIYSILKQHCDDNISLTDDSHVINDLNLESIALVSILDEIENEWDIYFDEPEISEIMTVGHLINIVENKLADENTK